MEPESESSNHQPRCEPDDVAVFGVDPFDDHSHIAHDESPEPAVELRGYRRRWARAGSANTEHLEQELVDQPCDEFLGANNLLPSFPDEHLADEPGNLDIFPTSFASQAAPLEIVDTVESESNWKSVAMGSVTKRARMTMDRLPWETGAFATASASGIWSDTIVARLKNAWTPTSIGAIDVLDSRVVDAVAKPPEQLPVLEVPAKQSFIRASRKELPDEDIRRMALRRLQDIILQDPLATQLGSSLSSMLNRLGDYSEVAQSFSDCFRMKASSTLQKRASSLNRLSSLLKQVGCMLPFRAREEELYQALCLLRSNGGGATSAQHMIESLFFMEGTAKLVLIDIHATVSGRCRGVARDMYLTKNPLSQKYPLQVLHVRILEQLIQSEDSVHQCILGQLLFCIHACCRWKDSQRLKRLHIERSRNEVLVHADSLMSKTSLSLEAKTRFIPFVAIGTGIVGLDWASTWLQARESEGLSYDDFALPSFSQRSSCWTQSPMSASEGTGWLRDFLHRALSDWEPGKYGSHSCKTTVLTWAGRCNLVPFTPSERRLLGHHLDPGMKSVATYARESYTLLYGKVLKMYTLIRDGSFVPDLSAVERVVQFANNSANQLSQPVFEQPEQTQDDSGSESSVASILEFVEESKEWQTETSNCVSLFPDFAGAQESALLVHRTSGVVHVANEDDYFTCGRKITANYVAYSTARSLRDHLDGCVQCRRAFQSHRR